MVATPSSDTPGIATLLERKQPVRLTDHPNVLRVASVAVTLGLWEWYGRGINPVFLSYPTAILAALPAMLESGELQKAFFASLQPLLIGFGVAVVLGILLGLAMGRYRLLDYLLDVQMTALYSTPNVALVPILILWFGLGIQSKIAIVILAAVFPILVNTYGGVRNLSRGLVEIAQVEG